VNKDYLKLIGHIVRANAADQSFLIEIEQSHNRLWVYADNKAFQRLNNGLLSAQFKGVKGKELTGTFHIQGRVLKCFIKKGRTSLAERYPALTALVNRELQSK
jgi:hypothetical protein